jgi:glycosyltransferase involved in cell wall biosynthesis
MKIVHIIPGFGGSFYCGNCLRDSSLVNSLRLAGHDAMTLPMYLPLTRSGPQAGEESPVFYGAVNIYLKQNFSLFRHMPSWMERMFNARPLLRVAAGMSGSTRAKGLEEMTESMLLGEEGFQREELHQLVAFLKTEKPDIIHLSNALLLGLAGAIRREVRVPVVYSLQDEDVWVEAMDDPWRQRIWDIMAQKVRDVDGFIAVSHFFAREMKQRLNIPDNKLFVVYVGVNPRSYEPLSPSVKNPGVGYLSRISGSNGFGALVDAFILLKEKPGFGRLKLVATGGMTADDKPFLRSQIRKLSRRGLLGDAEIMYDFRQDTLRDFFRKVTVLSVPVPGGEAFGLYQLEALASGVPLVQPAAGAFPEIIGATGGGEVYSPDTPDALASRLAELLSSPEKMERYSSNGIRAVNGEFSCASHARRMTGVYQQLMDQYKS